MLTVTSTAIEAVKIVTPRSFVDSRGELRETYNRNRFVEHGIALEFVQDTQSVSVKAGTIPRAAYQALLTRWNAIANDADFKAAMAKVGPGGDHPI